MVSRVQADRDAAEVMRLRRQVRALRADVVAVRDEVKVASGDVAQMKRAAVAAEPKEGGNGQKDQA